MGVGITVRMVTRRGWVAAAEVKEAAEEGAESGDAAYYEADAVLGI